jgi:nitroreductase
MAEERTRRDFMKVAAAAGVPLALGVAPVSAARIPGPAQEAGLSFFETVRGRRSVRSFLPNPVPENHMEAILDAARLAPTSGNQQPWKFIVVQDPGVIQELMAACVEKVLDARRAQGMEISDEVVDATRARLEGYFSAPAYVVVLTDNESRYPTYNHWDGPLAAGNLMLAARALGYGTVFITDAIPEDVTKEVLNIPDQYTRVCITPLGIPEVWPETPDKKALEELVVYERF